MMSATRGRTRGAGFDELQQRTMGFLSSVSFGEWSVTKRPEFVQTENKEWHKNTLRASSNLNKETPHFVSIIYCNLLAQLQRLILGSFLSSCWVVYLWVVPPASGDHPPRLLPPSGGEVYCLAPEAPQKGECQWGQRYFWPCWMRVGFGPATGPTLKMALCHIHALVGRMINNQTERRSYHLRFPSSND